MCVFSEREMNLKANSVFLGIAFRQNVRKFQVIKKNTLNIFITTTATAIDTLLKYKFINIQNLL